MYEWQDGMSEISGIGGSYEAACRAMLKAGLEWWDTFPDANPRYRRLIEVYGLLVNNDEAKDLDRAIQMGANSVDPTGGMTGAMHHVIIDHIFYIKKNGWTKYVEVMSKKL